MILETFLTVWYVSGTFFDPVFEILGTNGNLDINFDGNFTTLDT